MPQYQELLKLGPFNGLDTSTNDVDQGSDNAVNAPNADPFRDRKALATARGRVNLAALSVGSSIQAMAPAAITGATRAIYFSVLGSSNNYIVSLNPDTLAQTVITTVATSVNLWTQAFQYGIPLFCNDGTQIRGNNGAAPFKIYQWQYASNVTAFTAFIVVAGPPYLAAPVTYYYTMTSVTTFPDGSTQESSPYTPNGALYFQSVYVGTTNTDQILLTPTTPAAWSGTNADGSTWTTNIYRASSAQPTYFFLTNLTGTGSYTDSAADAAIASNAQLDLFRDQPPVTQFATSRYGVIFTYKDRAWNFVLAQNALTNNQPQCQLWYSDYGVPWSFNSVYQVLLVGNGDTALNPTYGGYGDSPAAALVLASAVLLFKYKSLFVLWGDDETTFVVRGIGSYEIVAPASAADCDGLGIWLDAMGVYACDGFSKPQYIGEDIRLAIEAIPRSSWAAAVGWYANRSYYLSFPPYSSTYVYYIQERKWRQLPYSTNAAFSQPGYQPPTSLGASSQVYNFICAARPNSVAVDAWDAAETDLGNQISATWEGPLQDSGKAYGEKNYRVIGLSSPIQPGVTATLSISVYDTGSSAPTVTDYPITSTIDLSQKTWNVFPIPQGAQKGYLAQVTVTLTNAANATTFAEIYAVRVGGTIDREWVIPD